MIISTTTRAMFAVLLCAVLLSGCISMGQGGNATANGTNATGNATGTPGESNASSGAAGGTNGSGAGMNGTGANATNQTVVPEPPKLYERYAAKGFSFEYPINMTIQESKASYGGVFSGTHEFDGQTGEILVLSYVNVTSVYGTNKEAVLKANPTRSASDFLGSDKRLDPVGSFLSNAYETGEISTFSVARDGNVAEAGFKIRFSGSNKSYTGYAMDIYVPERSLLAKVRIIGLDADRATAIRDNFLLSFRMEAQ
jgi:hypothetical protein